MNGLLPTSSTEHSILAFECVLIKTTGEMLPKKTFKHKYVSFSGMFGYNVDVKTQYILYSYLHLLILNDQIKVLYCTLDVFSAHLNFQKGSTSFEHF